MGTAGRLRLYAIMAHILRMGIVGISNRDVRPTSPIVEHGFFSGSVGKRKSHPFAPPFLC